MARNKVTAVKKKSTEDGVEETTTDDQPSSFGDELVDTEVGGSSGEDADRSNPVLVESAPIIAIEYEIDPNAEPVERFEVVRTCQATMPNGYRTTLKAGKVLDARSYDLENLRRQGVQLLAIQY